MHNSPFPLETPGNVYETVRALPRYVSVSTLSAAFVAALLAVTGPVLLIFEAARVAQLSLDQLNSWVFAVTVGGGAMSLVMAFAYRQPICGAWPIAGTVLLVTALPRFSFAEAIGAYLVAGSLLVALAVTGFFGRIMERIPPPLVMGMLAGVLFRFAVGIFTPLPEAPALVLAMLAAFVLQQARGWKAPTLGALLVGIAVAAAAGQFQFQEVEVGLTLPSLYAPAFSLDAALAIGVPLALLALTSQNAPGIGILWAQGYTPPANAITLATGLASLLTAPFGGNGVNMAAPMTAICSSPEAHNDPRGRYAATVLNGLLLIAFGLFAATATSLMRALPATIIGVVAGLALLPAIIQAFRRAFGDERYLFGAVVALAVAASDMTLLSVGAPFWSLVLGLLISRLLDGQQSAARNG